MALNGGCLVDANRLAAYSNPSMMFKRTPFGTSVSVSSNFNGHAHGEYNPETGEILVDVTVSSDPTPVIAAEAERADHLIELRRIETTYYLEAQKTVGQNFQSFGTMLAIAAQGGGEAVATMVKSAAPLLTAATPLVGTIMGHAVQAAPPTALPAPPETPPPVAGPEPPPEPPEPPGPPGPVLDYPATIPTVVVPE